MSVQASGSFTEEGYVQWLGPHYALVSSMVMACKGLCWPSSSRMPVMA